MTELVTLCDAGVAGYQDQLRLAYPNQDHLPAYRTVPSHRHGASPRRLRSVTSPARPIIPAIYDGVKGEQGLFSKIFLATFLILIEVFLSSLSHGFTMRNKKARDFSGIFSQKISGFLCTFALDRHTV